MDRRPGQVQSLIINENDQNKWWFCITIILEDFTIILWNIVLKLVGMIDSRDNSEKYINILIYIFFKCNLLELYIGMFELFNERKL